MIKVIRRILRRSKPGLGWVPNEPDDRDYDAATLGLPAAREREVLQREHMPIGLNQGSLPYCVDNTAAAMIYARESISGLKPQLPSRLFLAYNGRAQYQDPVKVSGTYLRTCFQSMRYFGVPDEEYWGYTTNRRTAKRQPPFRTYTKAFGRRHGKYYAIKTVGRARVEAIKDALALGFTVGFGTDIDHAFLKRSGVPVVDRPDRPTGMGHALCIAGYREVSGKTQFLLFNSWGRSWRNDGFVWVTERYIRWLQSRDFTIMNGWDRLVNPDATGTLSRLVNKERSK